jgi:hypothetical protein
MEHEISLVCTETKLPITELSEASLVVYVCVRFN